MKTKRFDTNQNYCLQKHSRWQLLWFINVSCKTQILLPLVVVITFLGYVLSVSNSQKGNTGMRKMSKDVVHSEKYMIYYKLVAEEITSDASEWQRSGGWRRYAAYHDKDMHNPMTVYDWATRMSASNNTDLPQQILIDLLKELPYRSIFFETKGVTRDSVKRKQFEFVAVDAPSLERMADEKAPDEYTFASFLSNLPTHAIGAVFENLGKDATLIAPRRIDGLDPKIYSHLSSFLRMVPSHYSIRFWRLVSRTYLTVVDHRGGSTTWLSTSGLGGEYYYYFSTVSSCGPTM